MIAVISASSLPDALVAVKAGMTVMTHPPRIVVDHVLQGRAAVLHLQQLVHLLLVFHDREPDLRVVQHEDHLFRDGVLIKGQRNASQGLRCGHSPIEARTVVADDRQVLAGLETESSEAGGEHAHLLGYLRPGPGLPDTVILFPNGGPIAAFTRVMEQQPWERIGRAGSRFGAVRHHFAHHVSAPSPHAPPDLTCVCLWPLPPPPGTQGTRTHQPERSAARRVGNSCTSIRFRGRAPHRRIRRRTYRNTSPSRALDPRSPPSPDSPVYS